MINILACVFAICILTFIVVIVGENIAENLPHNNKFKKWWRNNIIGDDIYNDDL